MTLSVRQLLLAVIILACPTAALANIGEDISQLRARYGSAKDMGSQMLFEHAGFSITVYFDGDHSAMEVFLRDSSDSGKSDISQQDIDHILAAESDGKTWDPVQLKTHNEKSTWIRSDKKLIARFSPNMSGKTDGASVLVIMLNAK